MTAYWIASKAAAFWNARLAASTALPAVASSLGVVARTGPAAAGGIAAVGGASTLAFGPVAALSAALFGVYEVYKQIKGFQEDQAFYKSLPNTFENLGTLAQNEYLRDPDAYIATHPDFLSRPEGRSGAPRTPDDYDQKAGRGKQAVAANQQAAASDKAAKAAADAAKKQKEAAFAADQYAANQERQARALEASQDAIRERSERTEAALQRQSDAIEHQIDVLERSREKILDFRRDVFASYAQFTSLDSLVQDPSRATAKGIVGSLQARNLAGALFTKNIDLLGQRGLDKGFLDELERKGPEARGIASALVQATPSQILALNAAERVSRAQAQALAATTTAQQFGPRALETLQRGIAVQNRLLANNNALLAALPKKLQQALKDNETTVKRQQKTAVTK